jgi:hypothetical protein
MRPVLRLRTPTASAAPLPSRPREPTGGGNPDGRAQAGELDHARVTEYPAELVTATAAGPFWS